MEIALGYPGRITINPMAAIADDLKALVRLLAEDPEQRAALREALFGDAIDVRAEFAMLAQVQRRTEEHLALLTDRVDSLTARVGTIADQLAALTAQVRGLASQMEAMASQMETMASQMAVLAGHVDELRGMALEDKYAEKGHALFGSIAKRLRALFGDEREVFLEEAVADQQLDLAGAQEIRLVDALYRCVIAGEPGFLVAEVSWGIGIGDVTRARERADILARVGAPTIAVVAGKWVNADATRAAKALGVWCVTNGRAVPPDHGNEAA